MEHNTQINLENESKEVLLKRIAALEHELQSIKKEKEKVIFLSDLNENLKKLQDNLKSTFSKHYGSLSSMKLPKMKFDISPWIESAAKSRNIDTTVLTKALSPRYRQLIACFITFCLLPGSILFSSFVVFLAIYYQSIILFTIILMYGIHIKMDKSFEQGSKGKMWIKQLEFWKLLCNYFPALVVKQNPDTIYDPKGTYMFGYHPHGIISVGCFVSFATDATGISEMLPGINIHPATLSSNFYIPFWRELLLKLGVISVSANSLKYVLNMGAGNAALVVPGGAAEALDAHPGMHSLTLNRRQGFFRIALQHGASLVPIYSFGENDLYEQAPNNDGTLLRRIQNILLKYIGFATPLYSGAGCSGGSMPLSFIPARVPVVTVIGDPIPCPCIANPTSDDIDKVRVLYIQKLQEIFKQFADKYAPQRSGDLEIVH